MSKSIYKFVHKKYMMVVKDSTDVSEWGCRPCSSIGRSQTEKMSVLPK